MRLFKKINIRRTIKENRLAEVALIYGVLITVGLGAIGYVMNIVKMVAVIDWNSPVTNELIIRLFGVVTGLGALIGWF